MKMTSMQLTFPEMVSDSLCRNNLVVQTDCCSSCPGGLSQMILEVKMLDVEVLVWCGYTWSAVVRPVGCTALPGCAYQETCHQLHRDVRQLRQYTPSGWRETAFLQEGKHNSDRTSSGVFLVGTTPINEQVPLQSIEAPCRGGSSGSDGVYYSLG